MPLVLTWILRNWVCNQTLQQIFRRWGSQKNVVSKYVCMRLFSRLAAILFFKWTFLFKEQVFALNWIGGYKNGILNENTKQL